MNEKPEISRPYGISEETTRELTGKTHTQVIDHLYAEVDKCSDGDITTVRTLVISLLAASLIGLSNEEVVKELNRVTKLLKMKGGVILNAENGS